MTPKIVAQLKTGSISQVIPFGSEKPGGRYVVVKEEADILGRGTAYRIIAHMPKDYQQDLKLYITNEVPDLLDSFINGVVKTTAGNNQQLYFDDDAPMPELTIDNDDDTISMERLYYTVDKLF